MPQGLSNIENVLTYYVRRFLTDHFSTVKIKKTSFISSLITCLVDASVVTFSIFTPQFISDLGYDQIKINIIGGAMNIGLYLTLPGLGYLSDAHGPILMALIGMLLCPGYLLASWCYESNLSYILMAFAFFLIGTGTSAAYFCSLLTCAKIYPDRKGLSISLPVTCYGVSSLILSYAFELPIFRKNGDPSQVMSVARVFNFLGIMYFFTAIINSVSSVIVTIEKEVVFENLLRDEQPAEDRQSIDEQLSHDETANDEGFSPLENEPLLSSASRTISYNSNAENRSLINSEFMAPLTHEARFRKFLRDPAMPLVYVSLFFLAGIQELFVANLGSLTETVGSSHHKTSISEQVALFSVFSTIIRLIGGFLNDLFNSYKATLQMIILSIFLCVLANILIAVNFHDFGVITSIMGLCFGSTYTLFPTLVATIWGVDLMGSTWGLFLSTPAFGDILFGLFYAYEYDRYCQIKPSSILSTFTVYCLTFPFAVFAILCTLSALLIFCCYRRYWSRNLSL